MTNNTDGLCLRVEYDLHIATFELADDVRHLVLEREFLLPIIRPLTQDEGLDDGVQQVRRQLGVGNHD